MKKIDNVAQILGDFTEEKSQFKIKDFFKYNVDVVLSDMAVKDPEAFTLLITSVK